MESLEFDLQELVNRLLLACQDIIYININNSPMINYIILDITNQICNVYELKENYERYMILNVTQFNITHMIQRYNIIGRLKYQVSKLQKLELPEQRSPEWYALRRNMLTASSLAAALGDDFFKSKNELILEKVEKFTKLFSYKKQCIAGLFSVTFWGFWEKWEIYQNIFV